MKNERILGVVIVNLCLLLLMSSPQRVVAADVSASEEESISSKSNISMEIESEAPEGQEEVKEQPKEPDSQNQSLTESSDNVNIVGFTWVERANGIDVGAGFNSTGSEVEFQWQTYDLQTQEWSLLSDWSQGNWVSFSPPKTGSYWIHVEARIRGKAETASSCTMGYQYIGTLSVKINGLSWIDGLGKLDVGAGYSANTPDVQFRYIAYSLSDKNWFIISDWDQGNWTTFVPNKPGAYLIEAQARAGDSSEASSTFDMGYECKKVTSVAANSIAAKSGVGKVELDAVYTSTDANPQFKWQVYNLSTGTWSVIQDWNTRSSSVWKPIEAGNYWIYLQGRTSTQILASTEQIMSYSVVPTELTGVTYTTDGKLNYTFTAQTNSHLLVAQYVFQYYDYESGKYVMIQNWSQNASASWTAPREGTFMIHVMAETTSGQILQYGKNYDIRVGDFDTLGLRQYTYVPYRYGGVATEGWDCSGFVNWALRFYFRSTAYIPRTSYELEIAGTYVDQNNQALWRPGDVLCFDGHVALYIGSGEMMHAVNEATGTKIQTVDSYTKWSALRGVRRYL